MNAMFSEARVKVSHRLAMHLHASHFQMRNAMPMVSFTFDDLPKSAVTNGADLLEAHGARGTFYVSGGLVGVGTPYWTAGDAGDVLSLYRRGHEIGCHTFSHHRACDLNVASLANEIMRNRGYFRALDASIETQTFAYPYGYGSFGRKHQLKDQFQLTVLMAEQNFTQAIRIADRGYVIVHGRIAVEGRSAEELNNNDLIRKFYLGL